MKVQIIKANEFCWYSKYIDHIFNVVKTSPDEFCEHYPGNEYTIIKDKNPILEKEFIGRNYDLYIDEKDCKLI